jgi:hypothetical protein
VRILYTRHAVYFGIRCHDSQASRIVATELRRDASQDLDDHFEILIDSNHDRRGAYVFEVNPLGTQSDGLIVEEQGGARWRRFLPGVRRSMDLRGAYRFRRMDSDRRNSFYNPQFHSFERSGLGFEFETLYPSKERRGSLERVPANLSYDWAAIQTRFVPQTALPAKTG